LGARERAWRENQPAMCGSRLHGISADETMRGCSYEDLGVPQSSEQERTLSPARSASRHASGRVRWVIRASCEMRLQGGHHRQ
jgi:hypothetical protein